MKHKSLEFPAYPGYKVRQLFAYAREGNIAEIDKFLREDKNWLNIPLEKEQGKLLIHIATIFGHYELVDHLIYIDSQIVNGVDNLNRSPLHFAVLNNDYELVKMLVQSKTDIEIKATAQENNQKDTTALGYAQAIQNKDCVSLLVKKKIHNTCETADPLLINDMIDQLMQAQLLNFQWQVYLIKILVEEGFIESIHHLLKVTKTSSALTQSDANNLNVLHYAAKEGQAEMLDYLFGIEWDLYLDYNYTAAKMDPSLEADEDMQVKALAEFKKCTPFAYSFSNLLEATFNGHVKVVEFLVEKGVDMNTLVGQRKKHLIHIAAEAGYVEIVKFFLSKNPDLVNKKDIFNQTPIFYTIPAGHEDVAKFLIEAGASLGSVISRPGHVTHGIKILDLSSRMKQHRISSLIINEASTVAKVLNLVVNAQEALYLIELDNSLKDSLLSDPRINQLISDFNADGKTLKGPKTPEDIKVATYTDASPLNFAKSKNNSECIKILQDEYLRQFKDKFSKEAYHQDNLEMAVKLGHSEIVYFLLNQGLVLDFILMEIAIKNDHLDLVQNFLSRDKTLFKVQQKNSLSIIEMAAMFASEEMVEYLIKQVKIFDYYIDYFIHKEEFNLLKLKINNDKIISLLILAISQQDKKQIPDLIDNAEQAMELINIDPSLFYLISSNEKVKSYFIASEVQRKDTGNENQDSVHLYKPENNRRKSIYLNINFDKKTALYSAALFNPKKELGLNDKSRVRELCTEDGETRAVKSFTKNKENKDLKDQQEIDREIRFTREANNLDGSHEVFHFFKGGYNVRFVQPCYQGLHADKFMLKIKNPQKLATVVYLIALELSYKNDIYKIVHSDIKANNILISDDLSINIIDFGLSAKKNEKIYKIRTDNDLYYPWYAPEVKGKDGYYIAKPSQDVYSLAVMFEKIFARHPCKKQVFEAYPAIQKFIANAKSISPEKRPKLSRFCKELNEEIKKKMLESEVYPSSK